MSFRSGTRRLTDKGLEMFEQKACDFESELEPLTNEINSVLSTEVATGTDLEQLKSLRSDIDRCYKAYEKVFLEFSSFLRATGTEHSLELQLVQQNFSDSLLNKVQAKLKTISDRIAHLKGSDVSETKTVKSKSHSSYSSHSSASTIVIKQKAKAEAAKVRLKFAEKQAQLERQQAELSINLKLLASQCDVDEAHAELDVIQEIEDEEASQASVKLQQIEQLVQDQQAGLKDRSEEQDVEDRNVDHSTRTRVGPSQGNLVPGVSFQGHPCDADSPTTERRGDSAGMLGPSVMPYAPSQLDMCTELSRHMIKRDLLMSRLTRFSERPEHFAVWQSSFLGVMDELNVSPREEIDLLVKWLGPESSRQAESIRTANVRDPVGGLHRIWQRLTEIYASPELVASALRTKLARFPKLSNKETNKLYEISDIVSEIESFKSDQQYASLLAHYDSSTGVTPIVNKLPHNLQENWTQEATKYKERHCVAYPPFGFFVEFIQRQSRIKNDPSFAYDAQQPVPRFGKAQSQSSTYRTDVSLLSRKTNVSENMTNPVIRFCPFHDKSQGHTLNYCKAFRRLLVPERKDFLSKNQICFKCCESNEHLARECTADVKYFFCGNNTHATAMHKDSYTKPNGYQNATRHGGENDSKSGTQMQLESVKSTCTQVCDNLEGGKSCAKTVLVRVFHRSRPEHSILTYAVLDDQSNRSLAHSQLFNKFNEGGVEIEYSLSSCGGQVSMSGRQASGYVVQSFDRSYEMHLPTLIECNQIPNAHEEIPSPKVAMNHPHLRDIAEFIPAIDPNIDILLLIGRDLLPAHHVIEQRIGSHDSPFAQKLNLGWVIVGEVCLVEVHRPSSVIARKIFVLPSGRPTVMKLCPNKLDLKVNTTSEDTIFKRTPWDEMPSPSVEDNEFLKIVDSEFSRDENGFWSAPLPFRPDRPKLPCNRSQAVHRANLLHSNLQKNPTKREHMLTFMSKVIDRGHAEVAPKMPKHKECWYLPLFGIYNQKKPGQIRGVFDSSAKYDNISLNSVLMTGPDLTNSLLGILLRFRTEAIAVTADVEQMFYCFKVKETHRDFFRFLWYKENDFNQPLIEYRMTAHVFGNAPSPAIATYGLRRSVVDAEIDVQHFVGNNFYVDDGLLSVPSEKEAVNLIQKTQSALREGGNIRLHKFASNSQAVLSSLDNNDLAKDIKHLDFDIEALPHQRSLELIWNLAHDSFTFKVDNDEKPFTRRGVLSTVNSLYDPVGFVAPVVIRGKMILRKLISLSTDWDEPLPSTYQLMWRNWCDSLQSLCDLEIPRPYSRLSFINSTSKEVHIFSDASNDAIAAVAYIKIYGVDDSCDVSFLLGKAKVAPPHGHTIPRLELCAAVLAVEMDIPTESLKFCTDSKVVLGYIYNERRRFHVYVANRIDRIRRSSQPGQWCHVASDINPADKATRLTKSKDIVDSLWLKGPDFLRQTHIVLEPLCAFVLVNPEDDKEIKPVVNSAKTVVHDGQLFSLNSDRFERFSNWNKLVRTISRLKHISQSFRQLDDLCSGWHQCTKFKTVAAFKDAENFIVRVIQQEHYSDEISCLQQHQPLSRKSSILSLFPILDGHGVLRVGGRLRNSDISLREINPVIIPKKSHIALLLVRHFHEKVSHQGGHLTEGALRSGGFGLLERKDLSRR